jgi:hypothetical protein
MEQSQLIRGLLQEQESPLRQQIALWDESTIWTTLWKKLREKSDIDHPYADQLDDLIKSAEDWTGLPSKSEYDFQLMKLSRLAEISEIKLPRFCSAVELNEAGRQIEDFAIKCLRESDDTFQGMSIAELAEHTIKKQFSEFTEKFNSASEEQKEKSAAELLQSIERLDIKDRQRLIDKLEVDELSTDVLIKLISAGTFATGFASAVSIAGFAAYTTLSASIATVSGLIGVTLPFAVYINAAAAMAFMTNPYVLIVSVLGLGSWMTMKSNKTIRRQLLPYLVAYSVVNQNPDEFDPNDLDGLANAVSDRRRDMPFEEGDSRKLVKKAFPSIPP